MSIESSIISARITRSPLVWALAFFFVELLVIGTVFKHGIEFNCLSNWPLNACRGPSGTLISIYCVCATLALFAYLFRAPFVELFKESGQRLWPIGLNIAGVVISLVPVTFLAEGSGVSTFAPALALWSTGMLLILCGLIFFLAPLPRWRSFLKTEKWRVLLMISGGLVAPYLATIIRPLWQLETIAGATFSMVAGTIQMLGYNIQFFADTRIIGADNFYIDIAPVCSGIEGVALVTIFVTLYLILFRSELRFPHVLILYPIGIIVSVGLNVVRIVALLAIGLEGNPELAVGGFHSHAGWLMFTVISLGVIAAANAIDWLRKPTAKNSPGPTSMAPSPFLQDPLVAMIFPFSVFMFSALLAQAFTQNPGIVYPARAALMAGSLLLFVSIYRRLEWRWNPISLGVGIAIGLMWIIIPVAEPEDLTPPYGDLSGGLLILWLVARGIGTTFLVPIIEELFFRGYLEQKFKRSDTIQWAFCAAIFVAVLFALLHDRWAEAFFASLAFSYVMHRSGRITDAIIAHSVANGLIFAVAVITQRTYII